MIICPGRTVFARRAVVWMVRTVLLVSARILRNATDVSSTTLALKKLIDETPDPADWCEKCDDSVESCACGEGEDA